MRRRAPPRRLRLPRIPKGLLLTLLLTLLTAWLIPALTRQWQDQQRAQELKAAMVTRIGRDATDALVLSSFIANGRFEPVRNEKRPFRIPMKLFNDLDLNWERNRREISAQLEAYFPDTDVVEEWRLYSQLTRDTYFLITEREFNRLWTATRLQRLLPARYRCKIESLREPFPMGTRLRTQAPSLAPQSTCKPSELKNPRSNYFFVATALLEAKSSLTEEILHADPDGLSTDTGDLFHDLLPLV